MIKRRNITKNIFITLALLLLTVALVSLAIILIDRAEDDRLNRLQNEALDELIARRGDYDEQTIVLSDTTQSEARALAERFGAKLRITENGRFATLTLPEGVTILDIYGEKDNRTYIEDMSADYYVSFSAVSEDGTFSPSKPAYSVNDSEYGKQSYIDYLNIGNAWQTTLGEEITVAIIDTGIDTDHPEFAGRISEYSYNVKADKIVKDYLLSDGTPDWSLIEDAEGHGTCVAGVIAAAMDGDGIVGVAPAVNLVVIKVGSKNTSDFVFGLYYAIERDVDIVNMSFGVNGESNPFADAVRLAVDSDIICVASAGNDATSALQYPAADENVIAVGALAENSMELAEYSNYGENIDIVAPGTVYTTAVGGTYTVKEGTSFSCPAVAGGLALYMSQQRYTTFEQVKENLLASCRDLGNLGPDWYFGYGAFDINALVCEERGKITFNMLTDELENIEQIFVRHHTLQNIPEPERTYSVFDGWYYDIDCTEPYELYADTFSADLTLYASWTNEEDGVPYTYVTLDDGSIEIRSYTGKRRYITIPSYIDDKPVTSIGESAFEGQSRLREITLPDTLRIIRDRAFLGCNNLVFISIPEGVQSIGDNAFEDNIRLSAIAFGSKSSLQSIGAYAFRNCSAILRFELPANVTNLNASAFWGMSSNRQFSIIGGKSEVFSVSDGILFDATATCLVAFPAGKPELSYTLPEKVIQIGNCAFVRSRLTQIDLGNVKVIGNNAFNGARLTSLVIPDSVISMGLYAFSSNASLLNVTLGKGLTAIPGGAFSDCSMLTAIHIPSGIMQIESSAFSADYSLSSLTFEENSSLAVISIDAFNNCSLTELCLPRSVVSIGEVAFKGQAKLTRVTFEEGSALRYIGPGAFSNNPFLYYVELPEGVTEIEKKAFSEAQALEQITLPKNLTSIGESAFSGSGLKEVTIPRSVSSIGIGAFSLCPSLENIFVEERNNSFVSIDGIVYSKDNSTLLIYPTGNARTEFEVPYEITRIGDGAFWGAKKLQRVTLPHGVISVGAYAFSQCTQMTSYDLSDTLVYILDYAFAENTSIVTYNYPDSLEEIGSYAFSKNTKLETVTIPDKVHQISKYAFAYDYALTRITFGENSTLSRISFAAFAYTGIREFRVPASVSTIAQYAFEGSTELYSIYFAENSKLETVSAYMFKGCESLGQITFGKGSKLTSLQAHAFDGLSGLGYINFNDAKLTNIDNYAFRYCERLYYITLPETVEYIGRYAFYGCKELSTIWIPESVEYIGENAFYFAENLDIYFKSDSLPPYLAQNWDNGIRGYYVGVSGVSQSGDWKYSELKNGNIALVEYLGSEEHIDLTALGLGNIVSVGGNIFRGKPIKSIVLPDTLTEIHRYAFAYTELERITIPDNVKIIAQYAFCSSDIEEVALGENSALSSIEQYAFANCRNLRAFTFPEALNSLGKYAFTQSGIENVDISAFKHDTLPAGLFMGCALKSVTLPDTLSYIDNNAFRDCVSLSKVTFGTGELTLGSNVFYNTGLEELYIPDNLTYIGEYSFVGITNLKSFTISPTHEKYSVIDGLLFDRSGRKLICAPAGMTGEITLPESLEILGFGAFENSRLTKINFHPNSNILTFGYRCFYNSAITELNVPRTVVSFDFYAFAMCKKLTTVSFADDTQLKGIYEGAFYGCDRLCNIMLPDSIMEIAEYAFYGCVSLEALPISETNQLRGIYDYAFAYTAFDELTLPDTLYDIGERAFFGAKLKSVSISSAEPENLIFGIGIFEECNELEEITVPFIGASFESEEITWFSYIFGAGAPSATSVYIPTSLKHVTINGNITMIGPEAFIEISGVEEIVFPDSISAIEISAFTDCTAKYTFSKALSFYEYKNKDIVYVDTVPSNMGLGFYGHLRVSESVTKVTESNFSGWYYLTEITLPSTIISIEEYVFRYCYNLERIKLSDNVTTIGKNAFYSCSKLESITLPSKLESIGDDAFYGCSSLTSINFPETLTEIGEEAFEKSGIKSISVHENNPAYSFEQGILFDKKQTTILKMFAPSAELVIPAGISDIGKLFRNNEVITHISFAEGSRLTKIPENAFDGCKNLTVVHLPEGVEIIESNAFESCINLAEITLPQNLVKIENYAFYNCANLMHITFPKSLAAIGSSSFYNCEKLYEITNNSALSLDFRSTNNGYAAYYARFIAEADGTKRYYNNTEFEIIDTSDGFRFTCENGIYTLTAYLGSEETITLPLTVKDNPYVIRNMTGIMKNVIIPEGITEIGLYAFNLQKNIESVTIPSSVTKIDQYAFENCTNLTRVVFKENSHLKSIESNAFFGCEKLTDITLPEGLLSVQSMVFSGCKSLVKIALPSTLTWLGSTAFDGCSALTEVTLSDSLTWLQSATFRGCSSLGHIELPQNLQTIGSGAFSGCTKLADITLPENVTRIERDAFLNCSSLTSITLPSKLETISSTAFSGSGIRNVYIDEQNNDFICDQGMLFDNYKTQIVYVIDPVEHILIPSSVQALGNVFKNQEKILSITFAEGSTIKTLDNGEFSGCKNLTKVILPQSLTEIGKNAFLGCSKLTEIFIPSSVIKIGDNAFQGCHSLTAITLPSKLTQLGTYAFWNCLKLTEVTIPNGLKIIPKYAFGYCSGLIKVTLPDGLTKIDSGAFSNCGNLTQINLPSTIATIEDHAFENCKSLTEAILPSGLTYLGSYVYSNCENISRVYIPYGIKEIYGGTFENCKKLTDVTIPESVTWLSGFENCISLTQIKIPSSVIDMYYTFNGCTGLESVRIPGNVKTLYWTFGECPNLKSVIIEDGVQTIENAFYKCTSLENIVIGEGLETLTTDSFYRCANLTELHLPSTLTRIDELDFGYDSKLEYITIHPDNTSYFSQSGILYSYDCTEIICVPYKIAGAIVFPEGITNIPSRIFYGNNITKVTLPSTVTEIGHDAFGLCSPLYEVINNSSLPITLGSKEYGSVAASAKVVVNPDGSKQYRDDIVDVIEKDKFRYYLHSDGQYTMFEYLGDEDTVTLPANINGNTYKIYGLRDVKHVIIPYGFTSISEYAFYGSKLESITLPESVTRIEDSAFRACGNLKTIKLPSKLNYIGDYAFQSCKKLTSINIPLGVNRISHYAFSYCENLSAVTLNNGVTDIEGYAFTQCSSLSSITFPATLEYIGYSAFSSCPLQSITIPTSVISIGGSAFRNCGNLKSIRIPSNVERIEKEAFYGCDMLQSVTISHGVKTLGDNVFGKCKALTYISLPESIVTLGKNILAGSLYESTSENWSGDALYIGRYLIAIKESLAEFEVKPDTIALSDKVFEPSLYTLKKLTIGGDYKSGELEGLTNLETLVLYSLPTTHTIAQYFGTPPTIPLTLRTLVFKEGCDVRNEYILKNAVYSNYGITNVTIFVETEKINVQWDNDFPKWKNGNSVYYGDRWSEVCFVDADGTIISNSYVLASQVVRQPFMPSKIDENGCIFIGWDINGDGTVDSIPATTANDIYAVAIFATHRLSDWIEQQPGCTEDGYRQRICLDCGEVFDQTIYKELGHTSSSFIKYEAPTCSEQGFKLYYCEVCEQEFETEFTTAIGHTFGDWVLVNAPTCQQIGTHYRICTTCGENEEAELSIVGHDYIIGEVKTATCYESGITLYACRYCARSIETITDALPHAYEKKVISEELLQILLSADEGILWSTENTTLYCYACRDCKTILTTDTNESAECTHEGAVLNATQLAPCSQSGGVELLACPLCFEIIDIHFGGESIIHNEVSHEAKTPSCTEIGWDAYVTCTDCNYCTYKELPSLGHYGDTINLNGYKNCERCGEEYGEQNGGESDNGSGDTSDVSGNDTYTNRVPVTLIIVISVAVAVATGGIITVVMVKKKKV